VKITAVMITALSLGLVACTTVKTPSDPVDPLEPINRQIFQFNLDVDKVFLQPVATTYVKVVPGAIRLGVHNFLNNIDDIPVIVNDVLQVNPMQTLSDGWRFTINTLFGALGLVDVASELGLKKHTQSFGLTMARWGWRTSAYIMVPIFGPYTVRDLLGSQADYFAFSVYRYVPWRYRLPLLAIDGLDYRADLLGLEAVLQQVAVDPYLFVRAGYLAKQRNLMQHNDQTALEGKTMAQSVHSTPPQHSTAQPDNHVVPTSDPDDDILNNLDNDLVNQ